MCFPHFWARSISDTVGRKCYDLFQGSLCHSDDCPMKLILKGEKRGRVRHRAEIRRQCEFFHPDCITLPGPWTAVYWAWWRALRISPRRKRIAADLEKANQELHRLTIIDGLTQIANRRRFDECLKQEWVRMARAKLPLSIIMCDVDCFKLYNDHYGHLLGDDCLRSVSRAIGYCAKRPADLAARYGGEEFAVLLPSTNTEGAVFVAESIRMKVQDLMIDHAALPGPSIRDTEPGRRLRCS